MKKAILNSVIFSIQNARKAVQELPLFVPCCGPDRHDPALHYIDQAISALGLLQDDPEVDTVSILKTKLGLIHHAAEILNNQVGGYLRDEIQFQIDFILAESEE